MSREAGAGALYLLWLYLLWLYSPWLYLPWQEEERALWGVVSGTELRAK